MLNLGESWLPGNSRYGDCDCRKCPLIDSRAFKYSLRSPLPNFTETLRDQARCLSLPLLALREKTPEVAAFMSVVWG